MPTFNVWQCCGDRPRVQLPKRHKSDSLSSANRPLTMWSEVTENHFFEDFIILHSEKVRCGTFFSPSILLAYSRIYIMYWATSFWIDQTESSPEYIACLPKIENPILHGIVVCTICSLRAVINFGAYKVWKTWPHQPLRTIQLILGMSSKVMTDSYQFGSGLVFRWPDEMKREGGACAVKPPRPSRARCNVFS